MVYPDTFQGFQIEDPKHWTDFKLNELTPKPFGDFDVDIKIQACGVCASDLHTISGGWGEQHFTLCVGHGRLPSNLHPPSFLSSRSSEVAIKAQS